MKKLAITIACLLMSVYTYGQSSLGTIQFDTSVGANSIVIDGKTGAYAATDCSAQLYYSTDGTSYTALGTPQSFFGDTVEEGAGFVIGPVVGITGAYAGDQYYVVMKAWRNADPGDISQSASIQVTLGGTQRDGSAAAFPAALSALQGFTINYDPIIPIPEPATIALGLIGAAALFLRRRQ